MSAFSEVSRDQCEEIIAGLCVKYTLSRKEVISIINADERHSGIKDFLTTPEERAANSSHVGSNVVVTLTGSGCVENQVGMEQIGEKFHKGMSMDDLRQIQVMVLERYGVESELIDLEQDLPQEFLDTAPEGFYEAGVLVIRGGVNAFLQDTSFTADEMLREQLVLDWDSKYFNARRKVVQNKLARNNLCYDAVGQEPDYANGKGRIVPWSEMPAFDDVRGKMQDIIHQLPGFESFVLRAEGNLYYDTSNVGKTGKKKIGKCGIGAHGDTERANVWAIRLGDSMNLVYRWFLKPKVVSVKRVREIILHHGDMYIMSEKATGGDWMKSVRIDENGKKAPLFTLRHSAGSIKYTRIQKNHLPAVIDE